MMDKPRKPRSDAKMYQLPKEIQDTVNGFLINNNMSYADIIAWLAEKGYKVSQSSLSRYAFKLYQSAQRIADDLEKTKYIVDIISKNPETDTTKATTAILKSGLLQRLSTAEEEFNEMPLEKASKLFIQLSKAEATSLQSEYSMKSKSERALDALEAQLMDAIKQDPVLSANLHNVLAQAREKLLSNE